MYRNLKVFFTITGLLCVILSMTACIDETNKPKTFDDMIQSYNCRLIDRSIDLYYWEIVRDHDLAGFSTPVYSSPVVYHIQQFMKNHNLTRCLVDIHLFEDGKLKIYAMVDDYKWYQIPYNEYKQLVLQIANDTNSDVSLIVYDFKTNDIILSYDYYLKAGG